MDFLFILNSALLGVGLAMDAFSVSLANGLHEPQMAKKRMCGIAGVYAFFQYAMPMIGWICVHTIGIELLAPSLSPPFLIVLFYNLILPTSIKKTFLFRFPSLFSFFLCFSLLPDTIIE